MALYCVSLQTSTKTLIGPFNHSRKLTETYRKLWLQGWQKKSYLNPQTDGTEFHGENHCWLKTAHRPDTCLKNIKDPQDLCWKMLWGPTRENWKLLKYFICWVCRRADSLQLIHLNYVNTSLAWASKISNNHHSSQLVHFLSNGCEYIPKMIRLTLNCSPWIMCKNLCT